MNTTTGQRWTATRAQRPCRPEETLRVSGVRPIEDGVRTQLRPPGLSPVMTFVSTAVMAIYVLAVAGPLTAGVLSPRGMPTAMVVWALLGIAAAALGLSLRQHARVESGREDLVINDYDGTLALPWTFGRASDTVIRFAQITEIAPAREMRGLHDLPLPTVGARSYQILAAEPADLRRRHSARGNLDYVVLVRWRDHDGESVLSPVARWTEPRRAIAFSLWLRDRVGVGGRAG